MAIYNTSAVKPTMIFTSDVVDIGVTAGEDLTIKMGDASAANKVSFVDSAGVEVASINSDGVASFLGGSIYNDDVPLYLGTSSDAAILWETADANANEMIIALPTGGATNVPVLVLGDATLLNKDLGLFNGVTYPTFAVVDDAAVSAVRLYHDGTRAWLESVGAAGTIVSFSDVIESRNYLAINNSNTSYALIGTTADDGVKLAMLMNDGGDNGNLILTTQANKEKDHDHETISAQPTLWLHSSTDPDTDNTQYLSLYHNATDSNIASGKGLIKFSATGFEFNQYLNLTAAAPSITFSSGTYGQIKSSTDDGLLIHLGTDGGANNNLIITAATSSAKDHDHEVMSTNPTVFFHSSTNPDVSNNEWGSITHDTNDLVIVTGAEVGTGSVPTTKTNGVRIDASTLTTANDLDYGLHVTRTLNDAVAFGSNETFDLFKGTITATNVAGWKAVNLINLLYGASSYFKVANNGIATSLNGFTTQATTGVAGFYMGGGGEAMGWRPITDRGTNLSLGVDGYGNNVVNITTDLNKTKDHGQAIMLPNPTMRFYSSGDVAVSNNLFGELTHNGGNFVISGGANVGIGSGPVTTNNGIQISPQALTSSGANDFAVSIDRTLNDTNVPAGGETFTGLKLNIIPTDVTGWDTLNLADLQWNGVSKFKVDYNGTYQAQGRELGTQGTDVASANDITLGLGNYFDITGTTQVNRIAKAGWTAGSRVILQFDGVVTVKDAQAGDATWASILVSSSADYTSAAGSMVEIVYDGASFRLYPIFAE